MDESAEDYRKRTASWEIHPFPWNGKAVYY
jgi:hypothetical protein